MPSLTNDVLTHDAIQVTLQKQTEELAEQLRRHGFNVRHFHAGMNKEEKTLTQDLFMESHDMIIVATIAFGMGASLTLADVYT